MTQRRRDAEEEREQNENNHRGHREKKDYTDVFYHPISVPSMSAVVQSILLLA